jgi:hypothetical protein
LVLFFSPLVVRSALGASRTMVPWPSFETPLRGSSG